MNIKGIFLFILNVWVFGSFQSATGFESEGDKDHDRSRIQLPQGAARNILKYCKSDGKSNARTVVSIKGDGRNFVDTITTLDQIREWNIIWRNFESERSSEYFRNRDLAYSYFLQECEKGGNMFLDCSDGCVLRVGYLLPEEMAKK